MRIAWTAVLLLPAIAAAAPPFNAEFVDQSLSRWDSPGAVVVVVRPNADPFVRGFGRKRLDPPAPMTADTVFPLASCSKAFTTTLAAMMADGGKLSFDDAVRKHLPTFHLSDPLADAHATLRDVFCHRTGLGSNDFLWYRSPFPIEDVVRRARFLPFERPFRTGFHYQSALYTAGGFAVAAAAGKPWDVLCRERIFGPLGMTSARCVTPPHGPNDAAATPYKPDAAGQLRAIPWYDQAEPNPAGSIHLNGRDLATWLRFQLSDGRHDGRRLVSSARLAETHEPHVALPMDPATRAAQPDTNLISYALGWVVMDYRGLGLVTHTGMIDGFRVQLALVPKSGVGVAVLVNRHQSRSAQAIMNGSIDRAVGLPPRDWDAILLEVAVAESAKLDQERKERDGRRPTDGRPPRALADYAGRFEHPAYGAMTVRVEGTKLTWEWNRFRAEMRSLDGPTFSVDGEFLAPQSIEYGPGGVKFMGVVWLRTG